MEKIIIYGIGSDFHTYFDEVSLYRSLTEEMEVTVVALCDGNLKRLGENVQMGDRIYVIQNVCGISEDFYDRIVVTSNKYFQEIRRALSEKGIDSEKMISITDYLHEIYYGAIYPYRFSIVLIIQNEASYLEEWMEYHRMLGTEHFYIYDNKSTDDLKEFLTEYIEQGIVTYQYWTGGQSEAYQHAVDHYKFESKYIAVIDVDEFLVPADEVGSQLLEGIVDGILSEHRERMKYYGIQKQLGGRLSENSVNLM